MYFSCIIHVRTLGNGTRRNLFSAFYVKNFKVGLVWNTFVRVHETTCAWLLSEQHQPLKVCTRLNMRGGIFCGLHEVILCAAVLLLYAGNLAFCIHMENGLHAIKFVSHFVYKCLYGHPVFI
jgi:hypothetical protein